MTSVLLELFRHKTWATLRLIEFCQTLDPEHIEASLPGTYGSVRATLAHLANAESGYYRALTDEVVGPPLDQNASLGSIAERVDVLGPRWEALLDDPDLPSREFRNPMGTAAGVAPMAQAVHHADDHRTQVLSILGSRGLELPQLDMWAYGVAAGFVRRAAESTAR